ncbi:hypothetical protein RIF29_25849 [Crotalaria pallida]|uniref:DNA N(6)-methyladenine demethylase n=1 Tax=Crotalaria pallida TaxID=3830 RepID=A0AAN9I4H9_CROPI
MFHSSRTIFTHSVSFHPPLSFNHYVFRQIYSKFSTLNRMTKTNNKSTETSPVEPLPVGETFDVHNNPPDKPLPVPSHDNEGNIIIGTIPVSLRRNNMKNQLLPFSTSNSSANNHPDFMSTSDHLCSPPTTGYKKFKRRTRVDVGSVQARGDNCGKSGFRSRFEYNSSLTGTPPPSNSTTHCDESLRRSHRGKKKAASPNTQHNRHNNFSNAAADHKLDSPEFKPYDICFRGKQTPPLIKSTLIEESNESCLGIQVGDIKDRILRPGMVLLKHYVAHEEQVDIVNTCRKLGLGSGGFYQPGYASGAKLRLKMMCLGRDWDLQTRSYGNKRVIDGSKPPSIPDHFIKLVMRAIQEAHSLIKKEFSVSYVEDILPSMSPDICIVNFYTKNGKLGLHRDRDESAESLQKGLPVVSFCIGDSAEFLYGDQRDVEKAENVLLESGDVLIFGGESRHVFHGVSAIIPDSAPNELLKDTRLRPGRLNLTFRQY